MKHATNNKVRLSRGFTMTEMLAVVAILVIVAAIAVGGWVDMQKNIQMNRLDTEAQQIYQAAQSRLADLQSAGKTSSIAADFSANRTQVTTQPKDYTWGNWSDVEMFYTTKGDSQCSDYLITPASSSLSSQLIEGTYIIEVSPSTAEVYGVFYVEVGSTLSYNDIQGLTSRERSAREDKRIGYYGGKGELSVAVSDLPPGLKNVKCDFVNGNDLYVKLNAEFDKLTPDSGDQVTLTLKGTDTSGNPTSMYLYTDLNYIKTEAAKYDNNEVDFVIDSLDSDLSFKKLCADKGVDMAPGCNITASLSISYKGKTYDASNTNLTDIIQNSLFASLDANSGTAKVANLRHLNNLRQDILGSAVSKVNVISSVLVDADIDFNASSWDQADPTTENPNKPARVALQHRKADGTVDVQAAKIPTEFLPLASDNALASGDTFDGQNHQLLNFKIGNTTNNAINNVGLFETLSGNNIKNVTLIDPVVTQANTAENTNGKANTTGALVGYATSGTIDNCAVRVSKQDSPGIVQGSFKVGGLIGCITVSGTCTVSNSYTCIPVNGTYDMGGFVGKAFKNGYTIQNCYSSGPVEAFGTNGNNGNRAGGFVGSTYGGNNVAAGTFVDCFTTSNVTAINTFAGFAGYAYKSTYTNCFSYGSVQPKDGASINKNVGGFAGLCSEVSASNCKYLKENMHNAGFDDTGKPGGLSFQQLTSGFTPLDVDHSHPLVASLQGKTYPFDPQGQTDYYGNWPSFVTYKFYDYDGTLLQESRVMAASAGGTVPVMENAPFKFSLVASLESYQFNGIWRNVDTGEIGYAVPSDDDVSYQAIDPDSFNVVTWDDMASGTMLSLDNKPLWDWVKSTAPSGTFGGNYTVDSEAPSREETGGAIAGTGDSICKYFVTQGFARETFSWRVIINSGTGATQTTLGTPLNESDNGGFIIMLGQKMSSDTSDSTAVHVGEYAEVLYYDAGRDLLGLPPYKQCTVKVVTQTSQGYTFPVYSTKASDRVDKSVWYYGR